MKHNSLVFFVLIIILNMASNIDAQIPSSSDTLKIVNTSGLPGEEIRISINLVNSFAVGGFSVRFTFDEETFSLSSISLTDRTSFMDIFAADTSEAGVLYVFASSFFGYSLPAGSGGIVDAYFNVSQDAQVGDYPFNFEDSTPFTYENQLSDTNAVVIIPVMIDGEVEVMNPTNIEHHGQIPENYQVLYNYPNPFNNRTSISFNQFDYGTASLEIYNMLGEKINTIELGVLSPGNHTASWDGRDCYGKEVASGVYCYALFVDQMSVLTKKMILLK